MTRKFIPPLLIALTLGLASAGAAQASGYDNLSQQQATQIRSKLALDGYEVRKMEREDGMIEVYALKDGMRFEIYLNENLEIVRVKHDD